MYNGYLEQAYVDELFIYGGMHPIYRQLYVDDLTPVMLIYVSHACYFNKLPCLRVGTFACCFLQLIGLPGTIKSHLKL